MPSILKTGWLQFLLSSLNRETVEGKCIGKRTRVEDMWCKGHLSNTTTCKREKDRNDERQKHFRLDLDKRV